MEIDGTAFDTNDILFVNPIERHEDETSFTIQFKTMDTLKVTGDRNNTRNKDQLSYVRNTLLSIWGHNDPVRTKRITTSGYMENQ